MRRILFYGLWILCVFALYLCFVNVWSSSLVHKHHNSETNLLASLNFPNTTKPSSTSLKALFKQHRQRTMRSGNRSTAIQKQTQKTRIQSVNQSSSQGVVDSQLGTDDLEPHCKAAFGGGFVEQFDLCNSTTTDTNNARNNSGPPSQFWCQFNPSLHSSLCQAHNLKLDKSHIVVSRGGEGIEEVIGRDEKDEYPTYQSGALELMPTSTNPCLQIIGDLETHSRKLNWYLGDVVNNVEVMNLSSALSCEVTRNRPTLLVTRYEYCNLYHTMTDWFNVFETMLMVSQRQQQQQQQDGTMLWDNYDVVIMDGHARGALDDTWERLFPSPSSLPPLQKRVQYLYQLPNRTCFRHAIWVPPGYNSVLKAFGNVNLHSCSRTKLMRDFSKWFYDHVAVSDARDQKQASYFGSSSSNDNKNKKRHALNVLFVSRVNYLAHPRQKQVGSNVTINGKPQPRKLGKVTRQIANEDELIQALQKQTYLDGRYSLYVKRISLELVPMPVQVQAFHEADLVVGVHGAGLSHVLFQQPKRVLLELIPSCWKNPHFNFFASWAGLRYFGLVYKAQCQRDTIPVDKVLAKVAMAVEHLNANVYSNYSSSKTA